MLDGMSDSIQGSRIENLHSKEVDRQSPTGLIFYSSLYMTIFYKTVQISRLFSGVARNLNWGLMVTSQTRPEPLFGLGVRMLGVTKLKFS